MKHLFALLALALRAFDSANAEAGYHYPNNELALQQETTGEGGYYYPKPQQQQEHHHEDEESHGVARYEFNYGVRDHHTGDIKNQWEIRQGDEVKGEYSLVEPDGTIRVVKYTADKKHGFNAVVTKKGKAKHPPSAHPKPVYGVPKASYSSDPELESHSAPKNTYGAPRETYGVPKPAYGVPKASYSSEPELESFSPKNTYGAPQETYGVPKASYSSEPELESYSGPRDSYGVPHVAYAAPKSNRQTSYSSVKPTFEPQHEYYTDDLQYTLQAPSESAPQTFYAKPELPSNHKPKYTRVANGSRLGRSNQQVFTPINQSFDYGINSYMQERQRNLKRRNHTVQS